ncbi:MAG: peptide deformylase [Oscillospiraceae bacterium]|nr:peptide deformylase [Oscillospiraceae bacterium]
MAKREIVRFGEDVLRQKCTEVTKFDEELWELLDDMYDTMTEANGVGLAAPQVGVLKRVVVIDVDDDNGRIELINPVITRMTGKQNGTEGCLSYPGRYGYVKRPNKVRVKALNRYGKPVEYSGSELLARAFCHEIDHLNGILFADKVSEWVEEEK